MDWADGADLSPAAKKPGVRRLLKTDDTTVVAFAFAAGQELREHTAAHAILITCARGRISFTAQDRTEQVGPGKVLRLDARVPHAVVADEEALMLLTMLHQHEAEELPAPVAEALDDHF